MLILLGLPVVVAVAATHRYLQFYAPSNLLVRRVRAHEPRWRTVGAPAGAVGLLLLTMHAAAVAVAAGAPGWLNLAVLVLAWDAVKLAVLVAMTAGRCAIRSMFAGSGVRRELDPEPCPGFGARGRAGTTGLWSQSRPKCRP
jgi:hypothetical protein